MIQPTPGRVVLFNLNGASFNAICAASDGAPLPALVARVWNDRMINVGGFDANGTPFAYTSLQLLQDDDEAPAEGTAYACWMPYQKAQAEKASAAA